MANTWDDVAANWDTEVSTNTYADKAFESLKSVVDVMGLHILDFGCGTGLLSQRMSPTAKDIVALDSSESMIEQLDNKELENVEPVVDILSRGLVAMHPAFRAQFDLVVASSVCSFLPNYSDVADIVYSLIDEGGYFVQWDWLSDKDEVGGMTIGHAQQVLTSVGFEEVVVTTPFEVETPQGTLKVLMAVAKK
ncbi:SAM-dependent methyltransferase [Vibrio orientalis CIP 102891 = ATCC 33934]|uniref:SAM-dependent methyltransferase n=1 Tax=Vibrio orientalis CIP 102891 = ATCC 33934 TaxID=675816 RepID=C9QGI9_VIBOR|nr:methyltransferase [Vibrio orientalis]EEX93763.1 SAM-dependent methyltransferase [Vibrio orientalis CIP 102891 = ATCC 33934]EGU50771.1 SAM-dependent methyltransferase [Vibrio orientalis CIP 102891 = ATCC 33934]